MDLISELNEKISKWPFFVKLLIGGGPVIALITWFAVLQINGASHSKRFYKEGFTASIIDERSYYGRTIEYELSNGFYLYRSPNEDNMFSIGDAVKKASNTCIYEVYRSSADTDSSITLVGRFDASP